MRSMDGHRESQKYLAVGSSGGSFFAAVYRGQRLLQLCSECGQEHCWGGRLALAVGVCSC